MCEEKKWGQGPPPQKTHTHILLPQKCQKIFFLKFYQNGEQTKNLDTPKEFNFNNKIFSKTE